MRDDARFAKVGNDPASVSDRAAGRVERWPGAVRDCNDVHVIREAISASSSCRGESALRNASCCPSEYNAGASGSPCSQPSPGELPCGVRRHPTSCTPRAGHKTSGQRGKTQGLLRAVLTRRPDATWSHTRCGRPTRPGLAASRR